MENEEIEGTLRVKEFARLVRLSPRTIESWIATRKIAVFRLGGRTVRIPLGELERLKREGFVPALEATGIVAAPVRAKGSFPNKPKGLKAPKA